MQVWSCVLALSAGGTAIAQGTIDAAWGNREQPISRPTYVTVFRFKGFLLLWGAPTPCGVPTSLTKATVPNLDKVNWNFLGVQNKPRCQKITHFLNKMFFYSASRPNGTFVRIRKSASSGAEQQGAGWGGGRRITQASERTQPDVKVRAG